MPKPKISQRKLSDLQLDQHNANLGTDRGQELHEQSIRELGLGQSVVADEDGNIIAGNKTRWNGHWRWDSRMRLSFIPEVTSWSSFSVTI